MREPSVLPSFLGPIIQLRASIGDFLDKQPYLTAIPNHGYQILFAFVLFTVTSWVTYFCVAPRLLVYSNKKKLKNEEHARAKWGHMAVSFLHAIIVCAWSLYLWYDNELADTLDKRVFGYSKAFGYMFAFSVGYFIWDVFCCIWYIKYYGKGFLVHAILGLSGLTCCYKPYMMYPTSRFLLFEFSTIFVDMHWFLEKLGFGGTTMMLINDIFGLAAYLGVRLIFGSYLTFKFAKDVYLKFHEIPMFYSLASLMAHTTTHTLNFYWFYKLARSIIRSQRKKKDKVTKPIHRDNKKQN